MNQNGDQGRAGGGRGERRGEVEADFLFSYDRSHFLSTSRAASTDSWNPVSVLLSVIQEIVSMVRTKRLRACRVCSVDTTNQLLLGGRAPQGANSPLFSEVRHPPQAQVGQGHRGGGGGQPGGLGYY